MDPIKATDARPRSEGSTGVVMGEIARDGQMLTVVCPSGPHDLGGQRGNYCTRHQRFGEPTEVVPASRLEGAVDALTTITGLPDTTAGSPTTLAEAREIAQTALDRLGGR